MSDARALDPRGLGGSGAAGADRPRLAGRAPAVFRDLLDRSLASPLRLRAGDDEVVLGAPRGGGTAGPAPAALTLRVLRPRFFRRVLAGGNLGLGEAWMDGDFVLEDGDLPDLLTLLLRSRLDERLRGDGRLLASVLLVRLANALRGRAGNVRRHYDKGDDLFESFLDESGAYSCGYVAEPGEDLARLQENKFERLCAKLHLRPGERLLDVGCGYGGLLVHAARRHGVLGHGVTLSRRHFERGRERVAKAGLAGRVRIELADYRALAGRGPFDKVVTVGMMEHVPRREYGRFVGTIGGLLAPDGLGLIHTVGCNGPENVHDPFIQKHVFPGSGQPRLSEIAAALERHRLAVLDVENTIRHYAPTAEAWLRRFREARPRLDPARYDDRFARMWEYYLSCAIAAARASDAALYQVLFARDRAVEMPWRRV